MTPKTLKALKGSISKWEKILTGEGVDNGPDNCPLCKLFYSKEAGDCHKCPVYKCTGRTGCEGSPYDKWSRLQCQYVGSAVGNDLEKQGLFGGWYPVSVKAKRIALDEVRFLESLLPKGQKRAGR